MYGHTSFAALVKRKTTPSHKIFSNPKTTHAIHGLLVVISLAVRIGPSCTQIEASVDGMYIFELMAALHGCRVRPSSRGRCNMTAKLSFTTAPKPRSERTKLIRTGLMIQNNAQTGVCCVRFCDPPYLPHPVCQRGPGAPTLRVEPLLFFFSLHPH